MSKPLKGTKVLDATRNLAGPFASMILGDLGAEVIKIEHPEVGDDTRHWGPPIVDNAGPTFLAYNRNKRSLRADLRSREGRLAVLREASDADVFIENFRPGKMEEYGLSYDELVRENSSLIYCSLSGYGQSGPRASRPAMDLLIQAASGIMSLTGPSDGLPFKAGAPVADVMAGFSAAVSILGRLHERERTSSFIDVSMLDSMMILQGQAVAFKGMSGSSPARMGNGHPLMAPYNVFDTLDGQIAIAVTNDKLWRSFVSIPEFKALDVPEYRNAEGRSTGRLALDQSINDICVAFDTKELASLLDQGFIPNEAVISIDEALDYVSEFRRGEFGVVDLEYPKESENVYRVAGGAWMSGREPQVSPPSL